MSGVSEAFLVHVYHQAEVTVVVTKLMKLAPIVDISVANEIGLSR